MAPALLLHFPAFARCAAHERSTAMAPPRGPVFSQGQTWLPPWLSFSPLESALRDTPSMFASYGKGSGLSSSNVDAIALSQSGCKEILNRPFPSLNLSDDGSTDPDCNINIEGPNMEDEIKEVADAYAKSKAFSLVLSLSQSQTACFNENYETILVEEKIKIGNGSTSHEAFDSSLGMSKDGQSQRASHVDKSIFEPKMSPTSEVSHIQHSQPHSKEGAEPSQPVKLVNKKKAKVKKLKHFNEDFQAAIRLTVASAETLVVADIMNECQVCQISKPNSIIDAALALKRGRETCGLDDFTLEVPSYNNICDLDWDNGLDDMFLQEDYVSDLKIDTCNEGKHYDTGQVVKKSSKVTELNSETTAEVAEIVSEIMKNSNGLETDTEQYDNVMHVRDKDDVEEQQHIMHAGVSFHRANMESASDQHRHSQTAVKDSYISRWFGGWTAIESKLQEKFQPKQAGQLQLKQAGQLQTKKTEKKHNKCHESTSDLSEPCDLAHHTENRGGIYSSKPKGKGLLTVVPQLLNEVDKCHPAASGSCAENVLASSQASVKCSLQEPICSFVPCSINTKEMPPLTDIVEGSGHQSTADSTGCDGTNISCPLKKSKFISKDLELGKAGENDKYPPEVLSQYAVKRIYSGSLNNYSMNHTNRTLLETDISASESQHSGKGEKGTNCLQSKQFDECVDKGCVVGKCDTNLNEQNGFILQDTALLESPPLTWHRGKRRRLRAYRMIESALIQDTCEDSMYDCLADCVLTDEQESIKAAKPTASTAVVAGKVKKRTVIPGHNLPNLSSSSPKDLEEKRMRKRDCTDIENIKVCKAEVARLGERRRIGLNSSLFQGLNFLITGFPDSQKIICEEISRKIQQHGGVLLSAVPVFPSLRSQKAHNLYQQKTTRCIVIAPQKVRTLKYLYGCSVGALFVKPNWIDDCISQNGVPPLSSLNAKTTQSQNVFEARSGNDLIFSNIEAFIHGQSGYCTRLSLLIQHGGGRLFQTLKSLVQVKNVKKGVIQIVIAEHQSKLPRGLIETAARFGVFIVSGDWVIDSLLDRRLLPLSQTDKCSTDFKSNNLGNKEMTKPGVSKYVLPTLRRHGTQRMGFLEKALHINSVRESQGGDDGKSYISFLGKGTTSLFPRGGLSFGLSISKVSTSKKLPSRCLYYKSAKINGVIYSAGEIVEIRALSKEQKEPYIAQIESFLGCIGTANTRSAEPGAKIQPTKPGYLCCRWFYRPSDTGFPCMGSGNELYLSEHIDHEVLVDSISKKVRVVLMMDDKHLTNDTKEGWKVVAEGSPCIVEKADYVCKFFYDYQNESLHQLKVALKS